MEAHRITMANGTLAEQLKVTRERAQETFDPLAERLKVTRERMQALVEVGGADAWADWADWAEAGAELMDSYADNADRLATTAFFAGAYFTMEVAHGFRTMAEREAVAFRSMAAASRGAAPKRGHGR